MNIQEIVSFALATRATPSVNRDLRKGGSKHTEHYAYPHILPLVDEKSSEERAIRIASLVASSKIPQGDTKFGAFLKNQEDKSGAKFQGKLIRLQSLSFEQAFNELSRMVKQVEGVSNQNRNLDWYSLANTLFYWGNGITERSLSTRQSFLKDYFRLTEVKEETPDE